MLEALRAKSSSENNPLVIRSQKILAEGCRSENPFVAIFSFAKLWPRNSIKNQQILYDFPEKHLDTIEAGLEHPHPQMRRIAAARIGSYGRLRHRKHRLRDDLLKNPNEAEMVRFQALSALGWQDEDNDFLIDQIAFNKKESILLRFI